MKNIVYTLISLFLFISPVYAEDSEHIKGFNFNCKISEMDNLPKSVYFEEVQQAAKQFALLTCQNMKAHPYTSLNDVDILLKGTGTEFANILYKKWSETFDENTFPGMNEIASDFAFYRPSGKHSIGDFSELEVKSNDECSIQGEPGCQTSLVFRTSRRELSFKFNDSSNALYNRRSKACKAAGDADCSQVLKDLSNAIKPYSYYVRLDHIDRVEAGLGNLKKQWDIFTEESRFQTLFDKAITTAIYSDELNGGDWAKPPEYQYFAFHPTLVVDYFDKENTADASVGVEWIGINSWNWTLPLGVSFTSVYTDRDEGNRIGHGLLFHVDNDYSIGVMYRGSAEYSLVMNMAGFNWFVDKQDKYGMFKDEAGRFLD